MRPDPPSATGRASGVRLTVLIVTYRRSAALRRGLGALAEQTRPPERLLVVDNAPEPQNEAAVAQLKRATGWKVSYLPSPENLGPAGGTALAMEHVLAEGAGEQDWLLRIDDDLPLPMRNFLELMAQFALEVSERHPEVGAVGVVGARYDWKRGRLRRIPSAELTGEVKVDYLSTGNFATFRMSAARQVGPFDRELFFGSSEVEYGLRLGLAGYSLYAHGELWAKHFGRQSAKSAGARWMLRPFNWRRYYSLRNQVHLLRKYGHPATALRIALVRGVAKPLVCLPLQPREAIVHLRMNLRAIRDGWQGRLGRTLEPES